MQPIEIHALSPDRLPDWLHFFDNVAFADNPDWQDCYCHFLHVDKAAKPWDQWTGAENRRAVIPLIEQREMNGMLAYADGAVIGWCHAGPSRCLTAMRDKAGADEDNVGSIGCFVVAKAWRHRGVARQLLRCACDHMKTQGMRAVQAYPRRETSSEADAHFGPLGLYLSEGFSVWRDEPGERLLTVRKPL